MTHTDPPASDSIECFNPTAAQVDLAGWYLTDDKSAPTKWTVPSLPIPASGHVVLDEDDFGAAFVLSSLGEAVYLFSPDLRYSDGFSFDAAWNGVSFGRYQRHDDPVLYDRPCSRAAAGAAPTALLGWVTW